MDSSVFFKYEVVDSELPASEVLDSRGSKVTTVICHGKLVAETRDTVEQIFKIHPFTGRIIMDLGDVDYVDSAGLGALIRLKMSAIRTGGVSVEYVHLTKRVADLLRITNLTEWLGQ